MHDLLTAPVIPVARGADSVSVSLPALYAALAADEVDSFPGLAVHQAQAWYQFLAQLGALGQHATAGGHALLMSATLGSLAWLPPPHCQESVRARLRGQNGLDAPLPRAAKADPAAPRRPTGVCPVGPVGCSPVAPSENPLPLSGVTSASHAATIGRFATARRRWPLYNVGSAGGAASLRPTPRTVAAARLAEPGIVIA